MDPELYVGRVLEDEGLAGDLDEAEATTLVQWAVARVEAAVAAAATEDEADAATGKVVAAARAAAKVTAAFRDGGPAAAADAARSRKLPAPPADRTTPAAVLAWYLGRA